MGREWAEAVEALAKKQEGMVERAQLRRLGVTRGQLEWEVKRGRWLRMLPGVFRLAQWPEGPIQRFWAAGLWEGEGAHLSHESAASLWGLTVREPRLVHVTAPHDLRSPVVWLRTHCRQPLPRRMLRERRGLWVTSPSRTLLDIGAILEPLELEGMVQRALQRRLTTPHELKTMLGGIDTQSTPGTGRLASVLSICHENRSRQLALERRLFARLRRLGIPEPECQYEVLDGARLIARVDFAWPEARVIAEGDSYWIHSSRESWSSDLERYNALVLSGWLVVRLTWADLENPSDEVFERLGRVVAERLRGRRKAAGSR